MQPSSAFFMEGVFSILRACMDERQESSYSDRSSQVQQRARKTVWLAKEGQHSCCRKFHPPLLTHDRSGSSTSSLDGVDEERQAFEIRTGWWWQGGPSTSCCFFFSLRAGMWLLAANALLAGVANIFKESVFAWITQPTIDAEREKYHRVCMGALTIEACGNLWRDIAHLEGLLDWGVMHAPLYHLLGTLLVLFSFVGFKAAYTGSARMAKNFMMHYPLLIVVDIVEAVASPSRRPTITRVSTCVNVYLCVYYSKVVWSFYVRSKIAEARRLSGDVVSKGHSRAANPQATHADDVV
ncbi:unnamed protein product [Ascophyllum nodosum]